MTSDLTLSCGCVRQQSRILVGLLTAGHNAKMWGFQTWGTSYIFPRYLGYTNTVSVDNKSGLGSTIHIIHLQFNYSNNNYYHYCYYIWT